jgi:hypothetical protein
MLVVQIEKYFGEESKHTAFRLMIPIFLLLSALLHGCVQLVETDLPGAPTTVSSGQTVSLVEYRDTELGFSFSLPAGWKGFTVRNSQWEGLKSADRGDEIVEQGPIISILHPESTAEQPRQEIPIMVFTTAQWDRMLTGEWHVGAAPISPLELGRNSRYVFALPARYNYAFLEGWEEVEQILRENPLMAFEPNGIP